MRVAGATEFKLTVERSRFLARLLPLTGEEQLEPLVQQLRRDLPRACHHCWALRLRAAAGELLERSRDDGEVGHPGRVLLELLRHHDLEGALLVSRVFGGVQLGVGGVSRAFRQAGEGAIACLPAGATSSPGPPPAPGHQAGRRRR